MDYRTLKGAGTARKVFKNSVFIGYASPANSEHEAMDFISKIKNHHGDATHNVSAYVINDGKNFAVRYDDNGEPKGSAGKPVLKVIQNRGLSNVVVVVTRYFGGIKLGYGGLVKAYSETANEAIVNAGIIEVYEREYFEVVFPYSLFHTVRKILGGKCEIVEEKYGENVSLKVAVTKGELKDVVEELLEATKGRIKVRPLG